MSINYKTVTENFLKVVDNYNDLIKVILEQDKARRNYQKVEIPAQLHAKGFRKLVDIETNDSIKKFAEQEYVEILISADSTKIAILCPTFLDGPLILDTTLFHRTQYLTKVNNEH